MADEEVLEEEQAEEELEDGRGASISNRPEGRDTVSRDRRHQGAG